MGGMTAVAGLGGAMAGLGLLLAVAGWRGVGANRIRPMEEGRLSRWVRGLSWRQAVVTVGLPLVVLAVTGWPVLAGWTLAGVVLLPRLFGSRREAARRLERLAAVAEWTRRLASVLTAGAGLEQAIASTTQTAPGPIAADVARLAGRLRSRQPAAVALRVFADDLADPTGDLVVAALMLAADRRGRGLTRVLEGLAVTVEAEVALRRQVDADRATPRATARYVTIITLVTAGLLVLTRRSYVQPFSTATGQLMLALIGLVFAAAFGWMATLTADHPGPRLLPASRPDGKPVPAQTRQS
jgi:Flp pilus assembly protein TadB